MTTEELLAKIKAEIEKQIKDPQEHCYGISSVNKLRELLDFLDTLEESGKPMNQEGLEKEYKDYVESDPVYSKLVNRNAGLVIARHFAQWGAEHRSSSEIPKDLEEAADKYAEKLTSEPYLQVVHKTDFIAGAKWHADHTPLPEDTVLFNKGVEEGKRLMMEEAVNERWDELQTNFREINEAFEAGKKEQREQMMKEAVEGKIAERVQGKLYARFQVPKTMGVEFGDKVRIIVLPKED